MEVCAKLRKKQWGSESSLRSFKNSNVFDEKHGFKKSKVKLRKYVIQMHQTDRRACVIGGFIQKQA